MAAEVADVGVFDVAGHDVADRVAIDPLPEPIGGAAYLGDGRAAGPEEPDDAGCAERLSGGRPVEERRQLALTRPLPAKAGRRILRCFLPCSPRRAGGG